MRHDIAIVGIACRFPDAANPRQLWETVLARRRAFRRLPPERLRLEDYRTGTGDPADTLYATEAALLEGWEFDRVRFRVDTRAFASTDLAHWLALETASDALADAGFAEGRGLPRERTGVLVGNTLTGEFSRAWALRLRWPYVRRHVTAALGDEGWDEARRRAFLERLERDYKEPFPETNEESLAGGLSNTIAGRIANHFDLQGGGYTVDGACASSLLAVANACTALTGGEIEVAVVGGVDLSLDPFELVGFARTGALAKGEMRVYDREPTGFLPGEGCGFVVLMPWAEAEASGRRVYARVRGWGVSSDGRGGLTRPEAAGQMRAVRRAYRRAEFDAGTVALFEGHGSGTAAGDATEIETLDRARREAGVATGPAAAALGSIKANIGHTKAAAGIAGLIKAALALFHRTLPPTTACPAPRRELTGSDRVLRAPALPEHWPEGAPLRAGVSAAGFGGINTHVALEGVDGERGHEPDPRLLGPVPDAELFALSADDAGELAERVGHLAASARSLSQAEIVDFAAELARRVEPGAKLRAALVAAAPRELSERLEELAALARAGEGSPADRESDVHLGRGAASPPAGEEQPFVPHPEAEGRSWRPALRAAAARFAAGAAVDLDALFADRFHRPFDPARPPRFLVNPCELAPLDAAAGGEETRVTARGEVGRERTEGRRPQAGVETATEPLDLVREMLAERTRLPGEVIADDSRLLSDLHLNSIAVGELVTDVARQLSLPPPRAPLEYSNLTVADLARTFDELLATGARETRVGARDGRPPAGVDVWVRAFQVGLEERPLPAETRSDETHQERSEWKVFAPPGTAAKVVADELSKVGGPGGVAVVLPEAEIEAQLEPLLAAARVALAPPADEESRRFVLVQRETSAAAFARSLHLEAPELEVAVVDLPAGADLDDPRWARRVAAEAAACRGFVEARYDGDGRRRQPVLSLLPPAEEAGTARETALGPDDVLLVTGGGRGIAAECALGMARDSGARLALIGRSRPEAEPELAANLERMRAAGVEVCYASADVTDRDALAAAVRTLEEEMGPVSGLLHAAGVNEPRLIAELEAEDVRRTLAPKLDGLRHLLEAVDAGALKLVVGFGSLLARSGMRGEADYGLANEQLRLAIEGFAAEHPTCRCLCVEWSVWSGVGMGERLSRLESLARQGVSAISPERGVAVLESLMARETPVSVVVSGRFGETPTLETTRPELPLLRFLERPRVQVPGVELVADSELSSDTDPYLVDHVLAGRRLFPAVVGLEAMAQAYAALTGRDEPPVFRRVRFERPIVVPEDQRVTLRVAALARESGEVDMALRCELTAFQVDHFRCSCEPPSGEPEAASRAPEEGADRIAVDPAELYGGILFQTGRFRRLLGYRELSATHCEADVSTAGQRWFSTYLPAELRLGDPGARDACLHAIQACIPHAPVLPAAVERIEACRLGTAGAVRVAARERSRDGAALTYDLEVRDGEGSLLERWRGLELRVVERRQRSAPRTPALLAPYLERRLDELLPGLSVAVALEPNGDRREGNRALRRLIGKATTVRHRPDGRPEADADRAVSTSYAGDLVLAVAAPGAVGCDVEKVEARTAESWRDLLGSPRQDLWELLAKETNDDPDAAATRIWTVLEGLKKAGAPHDAPLVLDRVTEDGWALFASGTRRAAAVVLQAPGAGQIALAVVAETAG